MGSQLLAERAALTGTQQLFSYHTACKRKADREAQTGMHQSVFYIPLHRPLWMWMYGARYASLRAVTKQTDLWVT